MSPSSGSAIVVLWAPTCLYSVIATTQGCVHQLLGILVLPADFTVITGQRWARVTGIILAPILERVVGVLAAVLIVRLIRGFLVMPTHARAIGPIQYLAGLAQGRHSAAVREPADRAGAGACDDDG
jgi:hypothetical protein